MRALFQKLSFLFRRHRVTRELDEELQFHLTMTQEGLREQGLSPSEAREGALRRVGSPLQLRERGVDVWIWRPIDALGQDLRFAWRMLRKQPAFTLIAAGTLALGIGVNTALFSAADAMLFRPLAVFEPDRLVWLFTTSRNAAFNPWSYPAYVDVRDRAGAADGSGAVLDGVAAYGGTTVTLTIGGVTEPVVADIVTANYFDVLGVRPALGRGFLPDEERAPVPVIVLSDHTWRQRFSSDPGIVGRTVPVNGVSFTVVGVAPGWFSGIRRFPPEVWVPMAMQPVVRPPSAGLRRTLGSGNLLIQRETGWLNAFARLKPGVTATQAQAAIVAIGHQLARERGGESGLNLSRVSDGPPNQTPWIARGTAMLFAIVGLVLLIACANVANLALARSSSRVRELAVRLALGVSRGRLLHQLLTEHLLIALIGGGLGVALATWLVSAVPTLAPPGPMPIAVDVGLDVRVLVFATALSLLSGLAFGLLPALTASRQDLVSTIREGSSQTGTSRSRLRRTLVVTQIALSLLLLIVAGLFIRSLQGATAIDPGFDRQARVLLGSMELRTRGYTDAQAAAFSRTLMERLQSQPGVQAVGLSHTIPLGLNARAAELIPEEARAAAADDRTVRSVQGDINTISPSYFDALGIHLRSGRPFTDRDRDGAPRVAIINDLAAARLWPGQNPLGKRLSLSGPQGALLEVVGVVVQGRYRSVGEDPRPYVYVPWFQAVETALTVTLRTSADPAAFASTLRREVKALDPYVPLDVRTLDEHLHFALWAPRTAAAVVGVFGVVAVLLAAIGLYGLMAHAVTQRTRELGVRMALGASRERLLSLILRDAGRLTLIGVIVGVAAALALTRLLTSALFGISPRDPIAFVSMAVLLAIISLVAAIVPAMRAMRVDPVQALRAD